MTITTAENYDSEACPGCGCKPGDGVTAECNDEGGCGYYKEVEQMKKAKQRYETPFRAVCTVHGCQARSQRYGWPGGRRKVCRCGRCIEHCRCEMFVAAKGALDLEVAREEKEQDDND